MKYWVKRKKTYEWLCEHGVLRLKEWAVAAFIFPEESDLNKSTKNEKRLVSYYGWLLSFLNRYLMKWNNRQNEGRWVTIIVLHKLCNLSQIYRQTSSTAWILLFSSLSTFRLKHLPVLPFCTWKYSYATPLRPLSRSFAKTKSNER